MADETVATEQTPAVDAAPATEAPSTAPEYTGRDSIEAMVQHSANEHFTSSALEALAAKGGELTAADLRTLPGAEGLSDAELMEMWQQTANPKPAAAHAATTTAAPTAAATAAAQRAWKLYQGDQELTDLSKATLQDLLDGKLQVGYQANKAEQRRAFDALIRNAQQGHYNAERMNTLQTERNTALEKWRTFEKQVSEFSAQQQVWESALNAATKGDFKPLQGLLDAYGQALNQQPAAAQQPQMIPAEQVERERAGQMAFQNVVVPKATEIATRYSLQPQEVTQALMMLLEREPVEFLTPERFQQIADYELPQHIEAWKAQSGQPAAAAASAPAAADPRDAKIAELQQQLQAARGTAAQQNNDRVAHVHAVRKNAPSPSASLPAGAGGNEVPAFKSGADAREWLRNL